MNITYQGFWDNMHIIYIGTTVLCVKKFEQVDDYLLKTK